MSNLGIGIASTALSSIGLGISSFLQYQNRVDLKAAEYEALLESILQQQSSATDFNQLARDFNNLLWSNFSPTTEEFIGGIGENTLNIGANTASAAINGRMSTGSPWGLFAGAPALAGGLAGYFTGKKKAEDTTQVIKENNERINKILVDRYDYKASAINQNTVNDALLNLKAFGGNLHMNDIFNNGVRFIEEGGSHEQNPLGGVPQGIAPDGLPNLVEEGELIFNDYVYSKRLKVPKKDYDMLGFKDKKEYTFADAAEAIQKESEERPNDPVSKRNLDVMMERLQNSLETFKQKRNAMKMKREFEKLSPEELAYMLQAMSQPQQAVPVQAQYAANGGHLFNGLGDSFLLLKVDSNLAAPVVLTSVAPTLNDIYEDKLIKAKELGLISEDVSFEEPIVDITKPVKIKVSNEPVIDGRKLKGLELGADKGNLAQALRAVPAIGSGIGALLSMFDKPNYSNIERAENMYRQIPMVSAKPIGNKMSYVPMDINYLMTQIGNLNIGNRRAIVENSAGNAGAAAAALLASNYKSTTAMGEAFRQANEYNLKQRQTVDDFNRGTDMYNSEADFKGQVQNQERARILADAFLKAGQLRDAELAQVQANKSASISNFLNNMGNLGTDMQNRDMVQALIDSGAYYSISDAMGKTGFKVANGGKLRKKGGKDA